MSILALTRHKVLSRHGDAIGRRGMSDRVRSAISDWEKSGKTDKGAMILAGKLKAVCQMASKDDYWREQVEQGFPTEYKFALWLTETTTPTREGGRDE